MANVLIVDDSKLARHMIADNLPIKSDSDRIRETAHGKEPLAEIERELPDLAWRVPWFAPDE